MNVRTHGVALLSYGVRVSRLALMAVLTTVVLAACPAWAQGPGTWQPGADMHQARSGHSATLLRDGKVLVVGGVDGDGHTVLSAEILDPATGGFEPLAAVLPIGTWGHTATLLPDDTVLIAGGKDETGRPLADAQLYDPATGDFSLLAPMITPRSEHTATRLRDGRVLLAGGTDGAVPTSLAEIYDPQTRAFAIAPAALAEARRAHTATLLRDGRVLIAGGRGGAGVLASAELYDATAGTVTDVGNLGVARAAASAALLLDGIVLIAGGQDTAGQDLVSAETYNPETGTFAPVAAAMTSPRSGHLGVMLLHNGKVLITGGTSAGLLVPTVEVWDPVSNSFWAVSPPSTARQGLAAHPFDVPYAGFLLASGGRDASGAALAGTDLFAYPTLRTDKPDYQPGDVVVMMGEGWGAGEQVSIRVTESNGDPDVTITTTTDATGAFTITALNVDSGDLGQRFYGVAVGQTSGWTAQNTFTDGFSTRIRTVTMSPSSGTCGASITVQATLEYRPGGAMSPFIPLSGATVSFTLGSATGSGVTNGSGVATATLTVPAGATSLLASFAGNAVNNPTSSTITFIVTGSCVASTSLSVTGATGTYGGSVNLSATLTSGGPGVNNKTISFTLNGTSVGTATTNASGVATLSSVSLGTIAVGSYPTGVGASFAGDAGFSASNGTAQLTVDSALLTITPAGGKTKVYGTVFSAFTGAVVGLQNSDAVTVTYASTGAPAAAGVGSYDITVASVVFTVGSAGNYTITQNTAVNGLTVTPAPLAITPAEGKTKVYGTVFSAFTGAVVGLQNSDAVTVTYASTGAPAAAGVGSYDITVASVVFTVGSAGNYTITQNTAANGLAVTPAPLTITATDRTKILGQTVTFSGTEFVASGLLNSDTVTSVTLTSAGAAPGAPVGTYPIVPSNAVGTGLGNYNISYVNGTLWVQYAPAGTACNGAPGHSILEPINGDGTSVFKQKSTIPAKFRVCDASGYSIGTPGVVASFRLIQVISGTAADVDEPVDSTTPDTAFRWSTTDQQWIFNMATKSLSANRTYVYRISLNDGTAIDFQFGLK